MATIADQLKEVRQQRTDERIARRSEALRKFVKEDLLDALKRSIDNGGSDYAPLAAPQDIRHLFAAPCGEGQKYAHRDYSGTYGDVWQELNQWAESEGLFIRTGHDMGEGWKGNTPWDQHGWGGSLGIMKNKPAKPELAPEETTAKPVNYGVIGLVVIALVVAALMFYGATR